MLLETRLMESLIWKLEPTQGAQSQCDCVDMEEWRYERFEKDTD